MNFATCFAMTLFENAMGRDFGRGPYTYKVLIPKTVQFSVLGAASFFFATL